ncbi:hypothetical protein DICPUDRAFT_78053 [Dictyostelium purpureum]|uniref:Uncharacterized protein n=1 Tax=Dictyostelium purpureum TaxID=5786 RepID=F0ZIE9_DICPU|nr:uncharacterized protein DICPUDRAFT_78053 [Dictyostelium purpureum]EGC36246.1 hypothetical protein DICPUDRAFT_78053 [Dictyostelium purpureum]|eukprot:XP_003287192.1 hypothetical protein DICPUDRAFT_78053 [Dictyostelium purpureum]
MIRLFNNFKKLNGLVQTKICINNPPINNRFQIIKKSYCTQFQQTNQQNINNSLAIDEIKINNNLNTNSINNLNNNDKHYLNNNNNDNNNSIEINNILKIINNDPEKENNFFQLFKLMKANNLNQVTLLSGENVSIEQVLIREISNNKDNGKEATIELGLLQADFLMGKDLSEVSPQMYRNSNGELGSVNLTLLEHLCFVLSKDQDNSRAYLKLSQFVKAYNLSGITVNGSFFPRKNIFYFAYLLNRDAQSLFDLMDENYPIKTILIQGGNIDFPIEIQRLLKDHPDSVTFEHYSRLASSLSHNHLTIDIPTVDKPVNRVDLQIIAINKYLERKEISNNYFSRMLYYLSCYLERSQKVQLLGKSFDTTSLLTECVNLNPNAHYLKCLADRMESTQKVTIKGKEYSRIEIIEDLYFTNHIFTTVKNPANIISKEGGYYSLYRFYHLDNIEKSKHYLELYTKEREIKKTKIIAVLNDLNNTDSNEALYLELYHLLGKDEKASIKGELLGKKECLMTSIKITMTMQKTYITGLFHEMAKFVEEGDTLELFDLHFTKSDLLLREHILTQLNESSFALCMETDRGLELDKTVPEDLHSDYDRQYARFNICINQFIYQCSEYSEVYYSIGKFLSNHFLKTPRELSKLRDDFGNIPKHYYLTTRDYFRKYLEYSEPILITLDNFKGWYSLSSEMGFDINDKEFGRTKSNILNELIQLNPSFSGIYHEYSKSLSKNTDTIQLTTNNGIETLNRIQLLLKGIDLENGITILKFKMMVDLLQCLSDTDYKEVSFLNGRTVNKHNLILETIEDFSHLCFSDQILSFLYKELYNTVDDDEEIEVLGMVFTKQTLKNYYLSYKFYDVRYKCKSLFFNLFK